MNAGNVAVVRKFLELLGETDPGQVVRADAAGAAKALLHPDCEFINPMWHPGRDLFDPAELPKDGILRGPDSIVIDYMLVTSKWDASVTDLELYDVDGFVLLRAVAHATGRVTGKSAVVPFAEWITVEGGLIRRLEAYFDTAAWRDLLP